MTLTAAAVSLESSSPAGRHHLRGGATPLLLDCHVLQVRSVPREARVNHRMKAGGSKVLLSPAHSIKSPYFHPLAPQSHVWSRGAQSL